MNLAAFSVLRHRDYRLLFCGMLVGSLAMPMQWIAQMWLVLELTDPDQAPLWLGVTGFARGLPLLLLSLYGGAIADRMDRRRLLLLTQAASLTVALCVAAAIALDLVTIWVLLGAILAGSTAMSFDQPTRQALAPDLVPRHEVASAVALNSTAMFLAVSIGPALAGFMIDAAGLAWTFTVIALTYVAVMLAVALMRTDSRPAPAGSRSLRREIGEGLSYVRREPVVLWLMSCTFVVTMLGMSFTNLSPVLVKDVLGSDARGLGLTMTTWGLGAVLASLLLAVGLQRLRGRGLVVLLTIALFVVGMLGFAYAQSLTMAAAFQFVIGGANTVLMVLGNAAILSVAPAALRGRVMGIYMMNRGMTPVGSLLAGLLGTLLGVRMGIAVLAIATLAGVAWVTLRQSGAWRRVDAAIAAGSASSPSGARDAIPAGRERVAGA